MLSDTILLTGSTGFLGTELAARLICQPEVRIYALVRASDAEEASHRLKEAWSHDKSLCDEIGKKIFPVVGDITKEQPVEDEKICRLLQETVSLVIHAGADTAIWKSADELAFVNTQGTASMLSFSACMKQLRRFVYISTAYVAGTRSDRIMEEEPVGDDFSSSYERSKAQAETLVRDSGLPFSICRPGMIIGDTRDGWTKSFNTVYYVLKLMLLGRLRCIPVRPDERLNIVPCDYVADAVIKICNDERAAGKTFHLTCPVQMAPEAGELSEYVRQWANKNLSLKLPKPFFLPLPVLKQAGLRYNRDGSRKKKGYISNLLTLMPYFFSDQIFDRRNTDLVCGAFDISWREYMDRLLTFACRKNFMRQTGQSVFEQARIRRASSRYPISYYDVAADGIRKVTGAEANEAIEKVRIALWARGIRKGDKVALTGINSVEYMILEQAIGLTGAVSVPIYYTTPAAEASLLLDRSGAKWFFIGDRRMMNQVNMLKTDAQLVSFSAGEAVLNSRVMRWNQFMEKNASDAPAQYPDPEDLATIRYTSGTTGDPKGVMFNFGQLAWMGEVLTNLLTWKERNGHMRYLSFLPLSHVVEGILASYAPYYVLCRVDYYYLNDFGELTKALPQVRPTVFFSVPRFYEKLWDQLSSNRLGKAWLAADEGIFKRMMGSLLRRIVLKKAGLDQCRQLIVGSAPVSETLLKQFRALGIEIYNAYGQTEAPLITINRLNDNVIPTIGTPLPDTVVTAEADGELIVKGPQVSTGYYGLDTDTIRNGVLRTGDLGVIDENGHITLFGRKKDMIVTAYGKNISIPKIEERLKDIPGVSEAVLIGENRPYCTALLWLEGDAHDLDARIAAMNEELSHPEQIRKYSVITKPLSIQAGELTPNLKVKRANVEAHLKQVIEEMYAS